MLNITLLSSFHLIQGNCNPNELYKIIDSIQPDIIFEELSEKIFNIVYSHGYNPQSLEAITIKKYKENNLINHLPVDTYQYKESELLSDAEIINKNSFEYQLLWKQKYEKINQFGFQFLNSDECQELITKITNIEVAVLKSLDNKKLLNELISETKVHDERENEMLKNIYLYCQDNSFKQALFICGAEHRNRVKQKIMTVEKFYKVKLNWTFYT